MDSNEPATGRTPQEETLPQVPQVWLTWVLLAANVLAFVAMAVITRSPWTFSINDLLEWGGNFAPSVYSGEFWRPLTSMFLHGGLVHLAMNMFVLKVIGPFLERLFGVTTYLLLYLLAGLAGSVFGMLWHPEVVSVGASGAIFGLYGGLLGFLLARRNVIQPEVLRPLLQNGLYFLGMNLVLGFAIPNVDVAAHLLGAAAGFIGGLVASWVPSRNLSTSWLMRNAVLALLCVAVSAFPLAYMPASVESHVRYLAAFRRLSAEEEVLLGRYNALVQDNQDRGRSGPEFAQLLEHEVLQPWSEMHNQFPPLSELPSRLQASPTVSGIYRYLAAMEESLTLNVQANRQGDEELGRRAESKLREAEAIVDQINKASGAN